LVVGRISIIRYANGEVRADAPIRSRTTPWVPP